MNSVIPVQLALSCAKNGCLDSVEAVFFVRFLFVVVILLLVVLAIKAFKMR